VKLSLDDLQSLAELSKQINRTAYHGGLGHTESIRYIGVIDRILTAHATSVDALIPFVVRDDADENPLGLPRGAWPESRLGQFQNRWDDRPCSPGMFCPHEPKCKGAAK